MTALGPLTTTFEAPSTCTASTPQIYQIWTGSVSRYEQGPRFTSGSNCFPTSYDASPQNYYSPGFCPNGYTAACSRSSTIQTRSVKETALVCCPTALSYSCHTSASWGCQTSLAGAHANIGVTVIRDGTTSGTTIVSESRATFVAHSIQVRFIAGDPVPTPAQTSLPTGAVPKTTIPPDLPTDRLPSPSETPPAAPGLTTPAAIGIGIGAALGFVLLIGTIAFFLYRRRRRTAPQTHGPTSRPFTPPPVPSKDPGQQHRASTYTHTTAGGGGAYELSTPVATNAFPWSPYMPYPASDYGHGDDKSTRTLAGAGASTAGGGRSRTNTIRTARTEETAWKGEEGQYEGFPEGLVAVGLGKGGEAPPLPPAELESGRKVVAELEGGSGVMAELEAEGPRAELDSGAVVGRGTGTGSVAARPESLGLLAPPQIGDPSRPASVASATSSAGWTIMRREGVQATPWL